MLYSLPESGTVFWIPIFADDRILRAWNWYWITVILYIFELFSIFFSLSVLWMFVYTMYRLRLFHTNLQRIIGFLVVMYYLSMISRIILLMFQIDWISTDTLSANIILFLCAFFRLFVAGCVLCGMLCITVERMIATISLRDYELHERSYISAILIIICLIPSAYITIALIRVEISTLTAFSICAIPATLAIFLYLMVWRWNEKYLEEVCRKILLDKYSLSVRFQLEENVRVMRLLRNIVFATCASSITLGSLFVLIYLTKGWDVIYNQVLLAIFELMIAVWSVIIVIVASYSVPEWKNATVLMGGALLRCSSQWSDVQPTRTQKEKVSPLELTKVHFSHLESAWN